MDATNNTDKAGYRQAHFSRQVRSVQFAYMRAAGSALARKATSNGGASSLASPSNTSAKRLLAIDPASTVWHDAGGSAMMVTGATLANIDFSRWEEEFV